MSPIGALRPLGRSRAFAATCVIVLAALTLSWDAAAAQSSRRWVCGAGECRAGFVLHTFWHDVEGSTSAVTALLESESGEPLIDVVVTVTVEAASLGTGIEKRDRKMRQEHLDTAGHPLIEFRSTAPLIHPEASSAGSATGSGGAGVEPVTGAGPRAPAARTGDARGAAQTGAAHRLEIRGELTLHGVVRAISLPLEVSEGGGGWIARGRFTVRLSDFGIPDPSILLNNADDEVEAWFEMRLTPHPSP